MRGCEKGVNGGHAAYAARVRAEGVVAWGLDYEVGWKGCRNLLKHPHLSIPKTLVRRSLPRTVAGSEGSSRSGDVFQKGLLRLAFGRDTFLVIDDMVSQYVVAALGETMACLRTVMGYGCLKWGKSVQ